MTIQQHASFDSSAAELNATSKLVKAWESKNAKNAARAGGVSLMALSLAACGGSDDVAVDITSDNADYLLAAVTAVDATATTVAEVASNASDAGAAAANDAIDQAIADAGITVAADATSAEIIAAVAESDNKTVTDAALTTSDNIGYDSIDQAISEAENRDVTIAVAEAEKAILGDYANATELMESDNAAVAQTAKDEAEVDLMAASGTEFTTLQQLVDAYTTASAAVPSLSNKALTTASDVEIGTASADSWIATSATYNAGDVVVDATSGDGDTLTVTATDDLSNTPTIAGIETITFNLDASQTVAASADSFTIDAASITGANKLVVDVTKVGSTVTKTDITNLKSGVVVETDLATTIGAAADADVTITATKATSQTVTNVTGTVDTVTINASAATLLTVADLEAEEAVTITNVGGVTISDLSGATTTAATTLNVTAGGAIDISTANKGSIDAHTTSGNIVLTDGDAATADVTLTADAGNIKVTTADNSSGTLTMTASGDITNASAGADGIAGDDGDIEVVGATGFKTVIATATGGVDTLGLTAATTLTVTAGEESDLSGTGNVKTLNLASNNADGTTFISVTGIDKVDNINISGENDVTLSVAATSIQTAAADVVGGAAAVIATDTSSGDSTIKLTGDLAGITDGTALDVSKLAVDEIMIGTGSSMVAATDDLKIGSGQTVSLGADQTSVSLTAAAVAGNTATLVINDDNATAVDTNAWDLPALTTANISNLTLQINDDEQTGGLAVNTIAVGASNTLTLGGAGGATIAVSVVASKIVAADDMTGALDIQLQKQATVAGAVLDVTTGSGNDVFTQKAAGDIDAYVLDGGDGVDTFEFQGDYSATALSLTNIETLTLQAAADVRAQDFSGKSFIVTGAHDLDLKAAGTGATVDATNIDKTASTLTITGGNGADDLTASATTGTTINAGQGNDKVTGQGKDDIIDGGAGDDVINAGGGADNITGGDGVDTITVGTQGDTKVDTVVLNEISAAANRDVINEFTSGSLNSDVVQIGADETTVATAHGTAPVVTDDTSAAGAGGGAYTMTGATTANADVIVLQAGAELTSGANGGDLSAATNGSELLKALTSDTAADTYTGITATDTNIGYMLAYQGGNAYLYAFDDDDAVVDGLVTSAEIDLVATFVDVGVDSLLQANFDLVA
jgi:hypothetical protein